MNMQMEPIYGEFNSYLNYVNISTKEDTIFEWKPATSFKNYALDIKNIRTIDIDEEFFFIHRGENKIVYTKRDSLYYSIDIDIKVQNQLIEAFIEYIISKFTDCYDIEIILSIGAYSSNQFSFFYDIFEEALDTFYTLDLVKKVRVTCPICKKDFDLIIKKKIIDNAKSWPVPIVCLHEGHGLLTYVDNQYKARGSGKVNFVG